MIDRFVCLLSCPPDCSEHVDSLFQVSYVAPMIGVIVGQGKTEEEADEKATIGLWEATAKLYALNTKEMMVLEKLLNEVGKLL